eukprot:scaffold820_cov376-Prasinococcus_capsulatus_cf.AAC.5
MARRWRLPRAQEEGDSAAEVVPDCWAVAFADCADASRRSVLAGYDNGDVKARPNLHAREHQRMPQLPMGGACAVAAGAVVVVLPELGASIAAAPTWRTRRTDPGTPAGPDVRLANWARFLRDERVQRRVRGRRGSQGHSAQQVHRGQPRGPLPCLRRPHPPRGARLRLRLRKAAAGGSMVAELTPAGVVAQP